MLVLLLVLSLRLNCVQTEKCAYVYGEDSRLNRIQGSPGKRGPSAVVDYEKLSILMQEKNNEVYLRVMSEVKTVKKRLEDWIDKMEEMNENTKNVIERTGQIISNQDRLEKRLEKVENEKKKNKDSKTGQCDIEHDGKCFWSELHGSEDMTFEQAELVCKKQGSEAANVYDETLSILMMDHIRSKMASVKKSNVGVWTGMKMNPHTKDVMFSNTTVSGFKRWSPKAPKTGNKYLKWTNVYLVVDKYQSYPGQGMNNYPPSYSVHGVLCEN